MKAQSQARALITAALFAAPLAVAAPTAVDDSDFDAQAKAIEEGRELRQGAGVFGRPGDRPGEEGPRSSAVGDRDLDRYVERLAIEIRLRNAMADRDPEGFH